MAIYFVDSINGNDFNDGSTEQKPLKSFEKLNRTVFCGGDKILLKRGSVFTDCLKINGNGTEFNPIVLTAYGSELAMPILKTVNSDFSLLVTGEYVSVSGIEFTNVTGKTGIQIKAEKQGAVRGVSVSGCFIHDVWTVNDLPPRHIGGGDWDHAYGGISIETNRDTPTWYEGLRIENNVIENVNRSGIWLGGQWNNRFKNTLNWMANKADGMDDPWYPHKNVYISHNRVDHAYGDGIVAVGCVNLLMEHNKVFYANCMSRVGQSNVALWTMNCSGALVQYNEVAFTGHEYGGDGEAFDIDQCNIDNIYQYNYSHDNASGFILICNGCNSKNSLYNNIVRNNISVNDATLKDDAIFNFSGPMRDIKIINNTIYHNNEKRFRLIQLSDYLQIGLPQDITFANNVFYSEKNNNWHNIEAAGMLNFERNVCCNITKLPERYNIKDNNIYTENPVLIGDGEVVGSILETSGFAPMWCSPLMRNGVNIEGRADADFFGTDTSGKLYIGAIYTKDLNI